MTTEFDPKDLIATAAPVEQLNPRAFASVARQMITPWQTSIRPSWTIAAIRAALLALRNGEFSSAAQLFDSMLEDDEIPGDLQKRVNALLRSEFHLVPRDGADRKLNRREQALAEAFPDMVPDDELFELISSWLVLGVGVATIDWRVDGPLWIPTLRTLPAEFLRYNEFERTWYYQSREGEQKVTPGDGKWVMLANGQRPWNWGLIRGLAVLWLSKGLTYGDWQRYCQKHGLPIIKAKIPIFRDDREKDRFIDDLSNVQSEGVVGLPTGPDGDGYDVELLEATDGSWESFQSNLDRADRKIQIMFLGSNIGTEQTAETGGSRAASETSSNGVDQDKAKADEKYVSRCLLQQFLRPFFALNFGPSTEPPIPHWDVCPEEDARAWADAQTAFVGMLNAVRTTGFKIKNIVELGQEYGLELEEDPDAPPPAGTEAAAEIAAKAKPPAPKAPNKKLDQGDEPATFEVLAALPDAPGDWIELTDDQVDALAAKGGGKVRGKSGDRTIQVGPRGGKFYISPSSGRKVYVRKPPPGGPKPKAEPKPAKPKKPKKKAEPPGPAGAHISGGSKAEQKRAATLLKRHGADKLAAHSGHAVRVNLDLRHESKALGLYTHAKHEIGVASGQRGVHGTGTYTYVKKGKDEFDTTLTHEFGHAVHMHGISGLHGNVARDAALKIDALVKKDFASSAGVSQYAKVNRMEHFAEAYTKYRFDKAAFRKENPRSYQMVEDALMLRGML